MIGLGHDLGLTVVAEGVETADQLRRLQQLRCNEVQGYYFGGPLSAEEIMAMAQSGVGRWGPARHDA